jgi:O-6-methylguanine DNA methyltransferase
MFLKGPKFQLKVWNSLIPIPKGPVKTSNQVATAFKGPQSAGAVANACGKTPYSPHVPCLRVFSSDGSLGGFSAPGGAKAKKKMLKKEGFLL